MKPSLFLSVTVVLLVAVALGACASGKAPGEQAIKAAEEALNASKAEAMKYVPEQYKSVEDALKAAKDLVAAAGHDRRHQEPHSRLVKEQEAS
jgi:hypothetical protein